MPTHISEHRSVRTQTPITAHTSREKTRANEKRLGGTNLIQWCPAEDAVFNVRMDLVGLDTVDEICV